ncbi:Multi-sensor signal transduction multi-kinase [Planktothrix sp. PCC 11201]|uniref:trifunctional serine/threonine-protein kinase/ATP-binding protein/sensor histidine kinase n=1 Tax=Planktothrix sp. PCC 11201 TaxID=1729650 RepID=UPI000924076C|nr:ATP-binding sensor histidine kinase [Planktothrix sp. PCC 11201]SKB12793.1 Multi-sensor signal transduction multi-kinase [Planktothrix sp. PCC 11201]
MDHSLKNGNPHTTVQILDYQIVETVYSGSRTLVYRAIRNSDQLSVIIKRLKNDYPTFSELVQFGNQYTITKHLKSPLIIETYSLEVYKNGYVLVMEDFGGMSLQEWVVKGKNILSLSDFLQIAITLCNILDILYRERIIHKDIKPSNILINPETKQIKLTDFSIASLLPRETQILLNPNVLEGTLTYISPEQTGRMNRGVDYRTDFYSLGVTFYKLLTKKLPFQSNDPMELVHCHIAKVPPLVHKINSKIPQVLSEIVNKLMDKNAEDRYQSALGLKYDLENCLTQLQETGKIKTFKIGQRDLCDRFLIPEKLYGREPEVTQLLAAFERVSTGNPEIMLVAGFSGIGKTALINEVHKPIVRQRGYFIKGKYDQFQRNIPFSAFVQAFRDLIGQLLSESQSQLQTWKTQILAAVGDNGQVLIDVIPELENIIGQQPPAPELSGSAAQHRFNLLFSQFMQVFTSIEHPLVMFLDDLQWADLASLNLLKLLIQDTGHLLILGAYRDNEVYPVHPLILTLDEIGKTGAIVNTMTLLPLSESDLNCLVVDTLHSESSLTQPLTKLVHQKTQGNPFFITQFLKALYDEKLISFNWDIWHWQCDLSQVKALAITDDIVEFMALQLQKLPIETQEVVKLAACIGAQFDLATLAIVSETSQSLTSMADKLWKALQEGLIFPITEVYKFFTQSDGISSVNPTANAHYKFLHDRVQQAAYSLIPDDQKPALHLQIGQLLLAQTAPEQLDEKIFAIVSQFNLGLDRITNTEQRDHLANLNLIAGRKARISAAYPAAAQYCDLGLQLLDTDNSDPWNRQPILTLELHTEAANSACLIGEFERVEAWVKAVLQHTSSPLEQVKILEIQIQSLIAQNQLSEAIQVARTTLKQLDVELPAHPTPDMIPEALEAIGEGLRIENVMNLPPMSDPKHLAAMNILSSMASAAYMGSPELYPLIVLKQIELSLEFGNAIQTPYAYSTYGLILCAYGGEIVAGNRAADIAIALMETLKASSFKAKIINLVYPFVRIWQQPIHTVLMPLIEGYQAGLASGDLEFAAYCVHNRCELAYATGNELLQLREEMQTYGEAIAQLNQTTALNFHQIHQQAVLNWTGEADDPQQLVGSAYDETTRFPQHQLAGDTYSIGSVNAHKLVLAYHFGQPENALERAEISEKTIGSIIGTVFYGVFYFYHALTLLANTKTLPISEAVTQDLDRLINWATLAPMNFAHKCDLIRAEQERILGHKAEAMEFYDRAIAGAKTHGFIQEEALANELAARFYWEWDKQKIAAGYMQEAYYCYARWGAKAKIANLEQSYPQLLTPILQQPRVMDSVQETITGGTISGTKTSTSISEALDLATLIKASQAISREIERDQLITTLLKMVIANAGASKCVLLLKQDSSLELVALVEEGKPPQLLPSIPLESSLDVAISLVNTVERTREPLVLANAAINYRFIADSYIHKYQPKSILCSPILNQGNLIGVLYLENNLTIGAFTRDRVELLNLICTQVAISLENARLYEREQQKSQALEDALNDLKNAHLQLVQNEKMSALGNLVAGVGHEMNNPLGFIYASLQQAKPTFFDLVEHLKLYQQTFPNPGAEIQRHAEEIDLNSSLEDLPNILNSMVMACDRLKNISTSLRTFSRADRDYKVPFNIHEGIDSTILILKHRLKANEKRPAIEVITNYGDLPKINCFPGQLNQVFMNILANALDALDESNTHRSLAEIQANPNRITITTALVDNQVKINIADNAQGMTEDVKQKIFDHLFTTKLVGKGTGLGLAIARQIVVEKHGGEIQVNSVLGEGTDFTLILAAK